LLTTEKNANDPTLPIRSATGIGVPLNSAVSALNDCAINVPSRTKNNFVSGPSAAVMTGPRDASTRRLGRSFKGPSTDPM
jgi:hypothetical protein